MNKTKNKFNLLHSFYILSLCCLICSTSKPMLTIDDDNKPYSSLSSLYIKNLTIKCSFLCLFNPLTWVKIAYTKNIQKKISPLLKSNVELEDKLELLNSFFQKIEDFGFIYDRNKDPLRKLYTKLLDSKIDPILKKKRNMSHEEQKELVNLYINYISYGKTDDSQKKYLLKKLKLFTHPDKCNDKDKDGNCEKCDKQFKKLDDFNTSYNLQQPSFLEYPFIFGTQASLVCTVVGVLNFGYSIGAKGAQSVVGSPELSRKNKNILQQNRLKFELIKFKLDEDRLKAKLENNILEQTKQ